MTEQQWLLEARTFLFVPGDRFDRFDKAVASGADVVILDLEDAVGPLNKDEARGRVAAWIEAGGQAVVRINGFGTPWFAADLAAVGGALGVMLPKAESAVDLQRLAEQSPVPMPVLPLIETAVGVLAAQEICAAPGVVRVGFGNVDLAADLGVKPDSRAALQVARSHVVHASRAAALPPPIDGVSTVINDDLVLIADALHGHELGFGAKLCIHPRQVGVVAQAFRPTEDEVRWAASVLSSATEGVGVREGQMIDAPVLARARSVLRHAGRDGIGGC